MLTRDLKILKSNQYSYDLKEFELALPPQKAPYTHIIKRYQIDYSYEQKYRLGILTPAEYQAWQMELYAEEQKKRNSPEKKKVNHTFWEDDEGVRENVSDVDYNEFLTLNNIDVSNENAVDIDALLRAHSQETQAEEAGGSVSPDAEEAGAGSQHESMAASAPLPGDDDPNRVLTPDEIAALFAAMGAG